MILRKRGGDGNKRPLGCIIKSEEGIKKLGLNLNLFELASGKS